MSKLALKLNEKVDVAGGAIEFTDSIAHAGQDVVARFHAWIGDSYREVELRVGDKARAGDVMFELLQIEPNRAGATVAIASFTKAARRDAPFETPFEMSLGGCVRLPSGQVVKLTGIGHFGMEVLFTHSNECENFTWFDFGFWREDGLLFEVESMNHARDSVTLRVSPEERVNRSTRADFGSVVTLRPRDVVEFPDGARLRLRRAQRQCYDAIDWNLYAEKGDQVAYPYDSLTTAGEPASVYDRSFRLLGRRYTTLPDGLRLEPEPALLLTIETEGLPSFPIGEQFHLGTDTPRQGPDGLVVQFGGTGHGHGTSMGPDGQEIPFTHAWADFRVVKDDETSGFTVDLMDFTAPESVDLFGFRFTVIGIDDDHARIMVSRLQ